MLTRRLLFGVIVALIIALLAAVTRLHDALKPKMNKRAKHERWRRFDP